MVHRSSSPRPVSESGSLLGLRAEVVDAYESGQTSRQVAEVSELGRTTVLKILKAAGVTVRPKGRR
jgi:hypothetical protein